MGTKGITNLPITAVVMGKRGIIDIDAEAQGQDVNIPVEGEVITTPAGNKPIKTRAESYLFNNPPKSPIDGSGGGNKKGGK